MERRHMKKERERNEILQLERMNKTIKDSAERHELHELRAQQNEERKWREAESGRTEKEQRKKAELLHDLQVQQGMYVGS